jgi:uncharacterized membrane protein SirB2
MSYALLKHIHAVAAAIVLILFVLRGIWMVAESPMLQRRWVRVLPHVNDTILLLAAIGLATFTGFAPFVVVKIAGLVLYVVLGTIALRRGRTKSIRVAAFAAALAVLVYIFAVAIRKTPLPFA